MPGYQVHGRKVHLSNIRQMCRKQTCRQIKYREGLIGEQNLNHKKDYCILKKMERLLKNILPSLQGNYGDYYEAMYHAIRNNAEVPVSGEEGMKVIQVIEAAFKSNKEKRVIEL